MNDESLAEFAVDEFLATEELPVSSPSPCPYLPGLSAQSQGFVVDESISGSIYRQLMDRGFRRSGRVFYRPQCEGCSRCIPYRVPTASFTPTRSQRRVWRRNSDIRVESRTPAPSDAKFDLYRRYLDWRHDGTMTGTREEMEHFLYDSPVPSIEFEYYVGSRLVGVSLADLCGGTLSSVYMYFDPLEPRRSLGTYSVLWEIEYCRMNGLTYYYLGYYVPGSASMEYKARFGPGEVLTDSGAWTPPASLPPPTRPRHLESQGAPRISQVG